MDLYYRRNKGYQKSVLTNTTINNSRKKAKKTQIGEIIFLMVVVIYISILLLPIVALSNFAGINKIVKLLGNEEAISSIKLGLKTASYSLILTFLFGTCTVFFVTNIKNKVILNIIDIIIQIPIVIPPATAGIGLLLAFGRNGLIGKFLSSFGINIVFTPIAVIIAQFFICSAFYIQVLRAAVDNIPYEIYEASYVFGASRFQTITKIILPMEKKAVISGLLLSWVRAMGEFGTTIMFAGNIIGKTRTVPLQIYTFLQSDITMAAALATILYILSIMLMIGIKFFLRTEEYS
jgi:molybdate transport system permease protein